MTFMRQDVMTATAAPKSHTVLDSGGKGLLSALVDFLQPVIQGYAASSGKMISYIYRATGIIFFPLQCPIKPRVITV